MAYLSVDGRLLPIATAVAANSDLLEEVDAVFRIQLDDRFLPILGAARAEPRPPGHPHPCFLVL